MEEVPKDCNLSQLESRFIWTRTLRTPPNNTNSNDIGNGNYKNIGYDSIIRPILIMMKKKGEQEEKGYVRKRKGRRPYFAPFSRCRNRVPEPGRAYGSLQPEPQLPLPLILPWPASVYVTTLISQG